MIALAVQNNENVGNVSILKGRRKKATFEKARNHVRVHLSDADYQKAQQLQANGLPASVFFRLMLRQHGDEFLEKVKGV